MNKLFITALIVILATVTSNAQYFPSQGDKQVVLGMSGNSAMILLRKFKTETICNRYGVYLSFNQSANETTNRGLKNNRANSSLYGSFSYGKQKNFLIGEKFSPYIALDASLNINSSTNNYEQRLIDSSAYNYYSNPNYRKISFMKNRKVIL